MKSGDGMNAQIEAKTLLVRAFAERGASPGAVDAKTIGPPSRRG